MSHFSLRVTTITPVYNNGLFLEACIQSLLSQSYDNAEYIFVDDGSTDDSVSILRKYENHTQMKMIYRERNGGISSAYKSALPYVTGDIICFLDADDIALPERLEKTAEEFEGNESVGIVYSKMDLIDAMGKSFQLSLELPVYLNNENIFMQMFRRGFFTGSGMAFRNLSWIKFDRDIICNDYYISLQLIDKGYHYRYIDKSLTAYRIHDNNTSSQSQRLIQQLSDLQDDYPEEYLIEKWKESNHSPSEIFTTLGINRYYFKQNGEEAKRFFERAVAMGGSVEAFFYLSILAHRQGDVQTAYTYMEAAFQIQPGLFHVQHNFGVLSAVVKGDIRTAAKLINSSKKLQPHYLLIVRNEKLLQEGDISSLKLIHFLSDEDAVYNSYCRLSVQK